ncbi:response regulator [Rheinheimera texasensis]|uniref:response regulator n=1 Tax=Rheinheimera texasensis TaxID=306205 RepID=UPI0004E0BBC6|nr:response regulator [Rheinheimera texasensis]
MNLKFYKSKKVLVVDDCDPVRASIKGMLQKIGFEHIAQAPDANTAIANCTEIQYDFILSDFNLGEGKDGYQLFEALKHLRLLKPGCCFIIISAESHRQIVHGVIELQPDSYLLKPFSFVQLEKRLMRAFEIKHCLNKVYQEIAEDLFIEAANSCELVIKNDPEYAVFALRLRGELLLKIEHYQAAEQLYLSILNRREYAWAKLGLAIARFCQQRWLEAEFELRELSKMDETRVEALDWLSRLFLKRQLYKDAYETLNEVTKLSPKNYKRQKALANLANINGLKDDAVKIYARLQQAARYSIYDTPDNFLNYARAIVELTKEANKLEQTRHFKKIDEILANIGKRFALESYLHEELAVRARVAILRGNIDEARELLAKSDAAQNTKPLTAEACLDKAKAYFEAGNLSRSDEFMQQLDEMAEYDDLLANTLTVLIQSEHKAHDNLREEIKTLNNDGLDAYQNGYYGRALEFFNKAFDYMPYNPSLALNLLQTISKIGGVTKDTAKLARRCVDILEQSELNEGNTKRFAAVMKELNSLLQLG